ncbi:MAG TPA: hypothetical protein VGM80_05315 [Gaiellaceae bacterium]
MRLAREGGMLDEPERARPPWDAVGIHGVHQARRWDAVVTVDAPELAGDRATFVALTNGELVVEEGPKDVGMLAAAFGQHPAPPYFAEAVRRDRSLWAVAARRIEVVHVPDLAGTEIELTSHAGERTLLVDGERRFGSIPALEHPEHIVRARRITGDAWEIETHPL